MFETLFPLFMLLGVIGLGAFFWNLFAISKFQKNLILEAEKQKATTDILVRPKTLEQYRNHPDKQTFIHYYRMVDEFNKLALDGKMSITSVELSAIKHSISTLSFSLYKKEHKISVYITIGLWLLMIPIGFWFLAIMAAFWVFGEMMKAKNFTKFESLINHYYSPQFKETNHSSHNQPNNPHSPSLAVEIQKLEDMRAKGVISDDEFSQLKKKLISA